MTEPSTIHWARSLADARNGRKFAAGSGLRSGLLHVAGLARRFPREPSLRCLYFHAVYDDQVDELRNLLTRLRDLGTFITGEELLRIAKGELPLRERCFHLSMDDGFDNIYRNAFPLFQELGIPATLFVPSALVGATDDTLLNYWWCTDDTMPLTRTSGWDEVREMHRNGIEIGSHTRHHVRLSEISGDRSRLLDEVAGSKKEIEDRLGAECRFFAWPFGTWNDVDEVALSAVEQAGYELCFSAVRGQVLPRETRLLGVPRHHFEPEWPWNHVRFFAAGGYERS